MYYVYILKSLKDGNFYTGLTNNLDRRIYQHNKGDKSTISTLQRGPFILVFVQECSSRKEARELEKYLKSGAGRELRDKLIK